MGRGKRTIPKRMPEKLKAIRTEMNYTLEDMVTKLETKLVEIGYLDVSLYSSNIYEFEKGSREPLLPVLLAYARVAGVSVDALVDDRLKLPKTLPNKKKGEA
jgi:transcriptional regulator with XRE-family HTH domain